MDKRLFRLIQLFLIFFSCTVSSVSAELQDVYDDLAGMSGEYGRTKATATGQILTCVKQKKKSTCNDLWVCYMALRKEGNQHNPPWVLTQPPQWFSKATPWSGIPGWIREAKKRGLTPEGCAKNIDAFKAGNVRSSFSVNYREDKKLPKKNSLSQLKEDFKILSVTERKQIQYALEKLGYYRSGIDGIWGNGTKTALTAFASAEGLKHKSSSTIFSSLLRKVSIPSNLETPKQNKNNYAKNKRPKSQGLSPIISNPSVSASQALAICKPQAELAGSQAANSYRSPSYGSTANCRGYGYSIDCDIYSNSGGFWGGLAEGLGQSMAASQTRAAVLKSCLAQYGWRK